ncbi:hypothetical protein O181_020376 [Austropuccinia psidii MF-1]|uniref:Uncharacterized protein n=1 Tax=Austropuccinia psidii MF-1 TaxID=1389203 RepID=A0A9Q3C8Y0_9BASI|nr:hypothetical protein [Austropuccinia psidii MF-1]
MPALHHREITLTARKRVEPLLPVDHLNKSLLTTHPTAKDFHEMWKRAFETDARCIAEAKEYRKQRWDKSHWSLTSKKGTEY